MDAIPIDTDACDKQVECIFLQEQAEGSVKPVEYWSRSLNKSKRHYTQCKGTFFLLHELLYCWDPRSTVRGLLSGKTIKRFGEYWAGQLDRKTDKRALGIIRVQLRNCPLDWLQTSGSKCPQPLPTTVREEYFLEDVFPILVMTEDRAEAKETETCSKHFGIVSPVMVVSTLYDLPGPRL